ncbi:MAG: peptidylprolyl isomerase [Planctomycetota bacterium]|nr:peptidylprolyl isomerase [Planctomycetota bacterium]
MKSLPALIFPFVLYGCAAPADSSNGPIPGGSPPPARPPGGEPTSTVVDARPAALVNGRSILWGELRPILSEAAGDRALQEIILDRRLAELTDERNIIITADDEAAEQRRLLTTLSDDPNTAVRLLDELRDRQNLGPHRYRALLRRNAMLRALVRDRVQITGGAVAQMYDARHGPRRQARLITVGDLAAARAALDRIEAGAFFGDVAVEISTDRSAPRGGLLEPVSRSDPSYPRSLREAIWALPEAGEVSSPILLDNGYAIVQLVREVEGDDVPIDDVRQELERLVRLNQERILMDRLARTILADASVTIFDDSLQSAWRRRERGTPP